MTFSKIKITIIFFIIFFVATYLFVSSHPLHRAVEHNNKLLISILSSVPYFREQKLHSFKADCWTPADIAINRRSYEALEILLKNHASFNGCRKPLLLVAIYKEDESSFDLLIKYGADVKEPYNGSHYLTYAAGECKSTPIIERLLQNGAVVNERSFYPGKKNWEGHTALYIAATSGCVENVKFLLANGADPL